jgi:hypothetical protein
LPVAQAATAAWRGNGLSLIADRDAVGGAAVTMPLD